MLRQYAISLVGLPRWEFQPSIDNTPFDTPGEFTSPAHTDTMQGESAQLMRFLWRACLPVSERNLVLSSRRTCILPSLTTWSFAPLASSLCTHSTASLISQTRPPVHQLQRGFAAQSQARPHHRKHSSSQRKIDPSGIQGLYLVAFTVAMIGVTYASVPLYRMFCQATGYGGTVQQGSTGC